MEFIVLIGFVSVFSLLAIIPTYLIAKRNVKKGFTFIPTLIMMLVSITFALLSRMEFEPGSWNDLVFVLYALIAFYASILSLFATFAINYYIKHKK